MTRSSWTAGRPWLRILACALVGLSATTSLAAAEDDFDEFVADLNAGSAAAATYLRDCEALVTPGGEVRQPCSLTMADLVGARTGVRLVVTRNTSQFFPRSQLEWREADVEARVGKKLIATFHVVEVGSSGGNPDALPGWLTASHWSRVIPDKDAQALARPGKLRPPPAVPARFPPDLRGSDQAAQDRAAAVDTVRTSLGGTADLKDDVADWVGRGALVFGSGAKQRYAGAKGAAAIRRWKLTLVPEGGVAVAGGAAVLWSVSHMVATPATKAAAPLTYVVFSVFVSRMTDGGSFVTEPALVTFSIAP